MVDDVSGLTASPMAIPVHSFVNVVGHSMSSCGSNLVSADTNSLKPVCDASS